MNERHISELANSLLEGTLTAEQKEFVSVHIQSCAACKKEYEVIEQLRTAVSALPKEIQPKRDLWSGIETRISGEQTALIYEFTPTVSHSPEQHPLITERKPAFPYLRVAAVLLICCMGIAAYFYFSAPVSDSWQVTALEGTPCIGKETVASSEQLSIGQSLITDEKSRAKLTVGKIGVVEVDQNTELELLNTSPSDHRLALRCGTIRVSVSALPRLFSVETPSSTAIDLGCAYTLSVDSSGASTLEVTAGWVALELGDKESVVPQGTMCNTEPGIGPGTPYAKQTSDTLRRSLYAFDFEQGGSNALDTVLSEAKYYDAITLWHLLFRVEAKEKERVYDRLTELIPTPEGVTREGVFHNDETMLQRWRNHLNLNPYAIVSAPVEAVSKPPPPQ